MLRGDVILVATGSGFGSKPRPALVIQSDLIAQKETFVVLPFTTQLEPEADWRPLFEPGSTNGLKSRSALMADVPITARLDKIDGVIGRLSPQDMIRAERALMLVLGFD